MEYVTLNLWLSVDGIWWRRLVYKIIVMLRIITCINGVLMPKLPMDDLISYTEILC